MNTEDATNFLTKYIRNPPPVSSNFGYDIYIPNVIPAYLREIGANENDRNAGRDLSPHFYAAAWELCRRGIIRPGINMMKAQSTEEGSAGDGYSVTPIGRQWLSESDDDNYVPTEPSRFSEILKPYKDRFGPQFFERSQEAIRCYGAHAYLACCVMCGAAAESILLATAIKKANDEDKILKMYNTAQGRSRVEKYLLGSVREQLKREVTGYLALLKYWRDQASHGAAVNIGDDESYISLTSLIRFAIYVNKWWGDLTENDGL